MTYRVRFKVHTVSSADAFDEWRSSITAATKDAFKMAMREHMGATGETVLRWQGPDPAAPVSFLWMCPGCGGTYGGNLGAEAVSGWDHPRWVNSGTLECPTLNPSLGCPVWREGLCRGHWWLRDGVLEQVPLRDFPASCGPVTGYPDWRWLPVTTKPRTDLLTTVQMFNLDHACQVIERAFGTCPYLVGTAGIGGADSYRDVDVRLMLDDEGFAEVCPTRARWEALCLAFSVYLSERAGLPVDFQIQAASVANERYGDQPRNPLGLGGRIFAGGGDCTPAWPDR